MTSRSVPVLVVDERKAEIYIAIFIAFLFKMHFFRYPSVDMRHRRLGFTSSLSTELFGGFAMCLRAQTQSVIFPTSNCLNCLKPNLSNVQVKRGKSCRIQVGSYKCMICPVTLYRVLRILRYILQVISI